MISNATDMPVIYGNTPVRSMANGGRTGYQNTGQVTPDMEQSHEERDPEEENFWIGKDGVLFDTDNKLDYVLAATMAIPVGGWAVGGAAKFTLMGGRLIKKGVQAALPSIQKGIGSFASKRGFAADYGGMKSIPLEQYGAQYIKSLGSKIKPYLPFGGPQKWYNPLAPGKFTMATAPALAGTAYGITRFTGGEDEVTPTPTPTPPKEEETLIDANQIPIPFEVGEVVTEDTGRRDDINTALVSLARIASAKPNELGNILASAGKDVAASRRERKRDELSEKLIGAQASYYEAKAEGAKPDRYFKAMQAYSSARQSWQAMDQDEKYKWGTIRTDEGIDVLKDDLKKAEATFIRQQLTMQNLWNDYQEASGVLGGGPLGDVDTAQSYLST